MSIYKDLNDVKLDLSEFEEIPLSEYEQKRILKKALKRIQPKKQKKNWLAVSAAVVAICIISIVLTLDDRNNLNLAGDSVIEDISSYKIKINATKENELGKLTLNEFQFDYQKIALKATFEPIDSEKSNYQEYIHPKVKVNGKVYFPSSEQSSLINDSKFRIYSEFELSEEIPSEKVNIEIIYDLRKTDFDMIEDIEDPWTYNVQVSQKKLLEKTKVFEMNKTITLDNGENITIEKVVSTPLSTIVYFDLSQSKNADIAFEIQSNDGLQMTPNYSSKTTEEGKLSFSRFSELPISNNKYFLIPKNSNNDEPLSEPIPIN